MRSYCRSVCGCMFASSAATAMAKMGAVGSMLNSAPRSAPRPGQQVVARVLVGEGLRQGLQVLGGFAVEVAGHDHLDGREQVADTARGLHAAALDPEHAPAGGAGRDLQLHRRAAECGHLDGATEGGFDEGHWDVDPQVVSFTLEHRMLAHRDRDGEVAGRPAVDAGLALAAEPDLLAIRDSSGNLDRERLAAGALQLDGVAVDGGGGVEGGGRGDIASLTGAAGTAEPAGRLAEASATEESAEDVVEPALGVGGSRSSALAEHSAEDVLEAAGLAAAARGEPGAGTHSPKLVVLTPLLRVGEYRVGLADLLELGLSALVARVGVRVVLPRQLAVPLLQVGFGDVFGDAQDLVEVLVEPVLTCHVRLLSSYTDVGGLSLSKPTELVEVSLRRFGKLSWSRQARPAIQLLVSTSSTRVTSVLLRHRDCDLGGAQ